MQEALLHFRRSEDPDTLWTAEVAAFKRHGAERLLALRPPPGDIGRDCDIRSEGFPLSFVSQYVEEELWRHDPAVRAATNRFRPFCRAELGDSLPLSPQEERFAELCRDYDLGKGVVIPVFGPRGSNGFVEVVTAEDCGDSTPENIYEMQTIAQMAHQRYCELKGFGEAQPPQLSDRENQILFWVAQGKSNRSIAGILDISANTVDTYLRRIYEKLDVTDRTRAAILGIAYGLIRP